MYQTNVFLFQICNASGLAISVVFRQTPLVFEHVTQNNQNP
jgi:hypothetical protein